MGNGVASPDLFLHMSVTVHSYLGHGLSKDKAKTKTTGHVLSFLEDI